MEEIRVIIGVGIVKDNKILMVQEGKKHCYGQWNIPAGHLEYGENLKKSAIREIYEETGYKLEITGISGVYNYVSKNTKKHCVRINFIGKIIDGDVKFDGEEIIDVKWFSFDELKKMSDNQLRSPNVLRSLLADMEAGTMYSLDLIDDGIE